LLDRSGFEGLLRGEGERSRSLGQPLSVLVGSIRVGEPSGPFDEPSDRVFDVIARDLHRWTRRADSPARIGHDLFAVLLPETDQEGAVLVAHRLSRATHISLDEEDVRGVVAVGVATYPGRGDPAEALQEATELAHAGHLALA
jgi:GGDEF domain-containing protein